MRSPIITRDLSLSSRRGRVYGPLTMEIDSPVTVLCGPAGSGRTCLLLTLAGRMKPSSGEATVLGHSLPQQARAVQKKTSISGFTGIDTLEESVSVADAIRERAAWLAPWWKIVKPMTESDVRQVCAPLFGDVPIPAADTIIWDLSEVQTILLRAALAMMSSPRILFVDQIEQVQSPDARAELWDSLARLGDQGTTIVASATAPDTELWQQLGIEPTVITMNQERR